MNLNVLNKMGPKTERGLNKLGIFNLTDLIEYYPYRYNFIHITDLMQAKDDELIYILANIYSEAKVQYFKKNLNRLTFMAKSNNMIFKVVIFNRGFLKNNLKINREILLIGKYKKINNTFTASEIKFNIVTNRIEPIYHLTEGIKNNNLENFIGEALNIETQVPDYIPSYLNDRYKLLSKREALKLIHQPQSIEDIKKAKLKLIYEELFVYMFKLNYLNMINKKSTGLIRNFKNDDIEDFISSLPFKLTNDQLQAIQEILEDIKKPERMNRLVLGDVGSGKTIVAVVAIYANFLGGFQATLMAPTEILANQHYESITNYLHDFGVETVLLTGSLRKNVKEKIYQKIKNNEVNLIIGTHALLNESIEFANLGLVITDEQHRFGVNQRRLLQNKAHQGEADVLYLSATPIPRTYALTLYGDMSISQIKSKPNMRKEIITKVKLEKEITDVLRAMWEELKNRHQIFVVSPLIENNEENELNSVNYLKEKLDLAFQNKVRVEIIHGKLKPAEKEQLMLEFQKGYINILISTTVIEVGIDIPNATMMVIFNAERFGLATLHQLRGRVGRNDLQSYCFLITNTKDNERLKVMEESSDGFYISEKDFEQRGQGDLFGIKQSGDMTFKLANLKNDYRILVQAGKDAREFLKNEAYLQIPIYQNLLEKINFLE